MTDVTQILNQIEDGDPSAAELLLPLVYNELRRLAAGKLAGEPAGQTLQATALVHEAYMRLVTAQPDQHWTGRRHFFAAAAEVMRRILVDNARKKKRLKRGGERGRVDFYVDLPVAESHSEDILALHESLDRLAEEDAIAAEVVKLKYFAGLTVVEIADLLGISTRTADRRWSYARAWLHQEIRA